VFPELHAQLDYVSRVILEEENSFLRTLDLGLRRVDAIQAELKSKTISGAQAFELYDTYGFPFDLTSLIARERGFSVDEEGFRLEMEKQKARSKKDAAKETGDWIAVADADQVQFTGYEHLEAAAHIIKYRKIKQKGEERVQLVFGHTPFYAESGGQVGDTGWMVCGEEKIRIVDTRKENELIVHYVLELPRQMDSTWQLQVDRARRQAIMKNHTATHLLHAALREALGKHVEQKGSLVNEHLLRFDFAHFAAMTEQEVQQVEDRVNEKIREDIFLLEERNVPLEMARQKGAMALFGEKYGEFVRVITFGPDYSVELCGGTHVPSTGRIGFFKILSEGSVAAGVRRMEAVTAQEAGHWVRTQLQQLGEIKEILKNPKDAIAAARNLLSEKLTLEKKLEEVNARQALHIKNTLAASAMVGNDRTLIIEQVQLASAEGLKSIAFALRNQFPNLLLILAADVEGKPHVAVMLGEALAAKKIVHAGQMVKELALEIEGGGGGQDFFAMAGGKKPEGLPGVIRKAKEMTAPKG